MDTADGRREDTKPYVPCDPNLTYFYTRREEAARRRHRVQPRAVNLDCGLFSAYSSTSV